MGCEGRRAAVNQCCIATRGRSHLPAPPHLVGASLLAIRTGTWAPRLHLPHRGQGRSHKSTLDPSSGSDFRGCELARDRLNDRRLRSPFHAHAASTATAILPARPVDYPTVRPIAHDNVQYAPAGSGPPKSARQPGNGTGGRVRARRRPWLPTDIPCCPVPPAPARKAVPRSTESAQRFAAGTSMTSSIAPRSPTMRSSGRYMSSTKVPGTV